MNRETFTNTGILNLSHLGQSGIENASSGSAVFTVSAGSQVNILDARRGISNFSFGSGNVFFTVENGANIQIDSTGEEGILNSSAQLTVGGSIMMTTGISLAGILNKSNAIIDIQNTGLISLDGITGDPLVNEKRTIKGSGTITDLTGKAIINKRDWSPGASPGTLTVNGNLDMSVAASTYNVEINSTTNDSTIVMGDLTLGGRLDVSLLGGFAPAALDTFSIMTFSGVLSGTFATVILPSPEMDGWVVDYGTLKPGEIILISMTPLPISGLRFELRREQNMAQLSWRTSSEINNRGFEIEYSTDAEAWDVIGFVAGHGTTNQPRQYHYTHRLQKGINYYRLRQIDFDGQFEYSPVRRVSLLDDIDFILYPNPVSEYLHIEVADKQKDNLHIRIYNASGVKVIEQIVHNGEAIPVFDLPSGWYIFHTELESKEVIKKFVKE